MKKIIIKNIHEFNKFVSFFIKELQSRDHATIITLSGDLGSGKTAFVKEVARFFKIDEEITSPTFVIQKEYKLAGDFAFKKIIHIDAYRLENKSELEYLGWNELIQNPENIIFIEWPEQVDGINMEGAIQISIKILDNESREIEILKE